MPDEDDLELRPAALAGVYFPVDPESLEDLACGLTEMYTALGFGPDRVLAVFRDPSRPVPYTVYQKLGEDELRRIVDEAFHSRS
jgi:hypothetical protein